MVNRQDWMLELEMDAKNFASLINRIDELSIKAIDEWRRGNARSALIILGEIREGLDLIRKICNLPNVH